MQCALYFFFFPVADTYVYMAPRFSSLAPPQRIHASRLVFNPMILIASSYQYRCVSPVLAHLQMHMFLFGCVLSFAGMIEKRAIQPPTHADSFRANEFGQNMMKQNQNRHMMQHGRKIERGEMHIREKKKGWNRNKRHWPLTNNGTNWDRVWDGGWRRRRMKGMVVVRNSFTENVSHIHDYSHAIEWCT